MGQPIPVQGKLPNAAADIFSPSVGCKVTFFRLINSSGSNVAITITVRAIGGVIVNLVPAAFVLNAGYTLDVIDPGQTLDLCQGEVITGLAGTAGGLGYRINALPV